MKFLHEQDQYKELTYNDVFLMPQKSDVISRMDVDLTPNEAIGTTIPIVVSNMMAVAGRRMTETITRRGGLVVLPQDYSIEKIASIVTYIKQCHHIFDTPVTLTETESVQTALNLIYKRSHGAIVIVDAHNKPVGIFTEADAYRRDRYSQLSDAMTTSLVTIPFNSSPQEAFNLLHEKRLSFAPVVNFEGVLIGALTKKAALRADMYRAAVNTHNEFLTAVAIGIGKNFEERLQQLNFLGVDIIVLDAAHGHQKRMLDAIKYARSVLGTQKHLVAGNIVSESAADDFIQAGASILKVGVGPGAMCTTRMMTGVGRPQFSAVYNTSNIARRYGAHVWADGGIKHPRDIALAIASGASSVMIGSWFAGTYESPADTIRDSEGRLYKENYGMASRRAVQNRNEQYNPYEQARKQYFEEGVSTSKLYLKPDQSSVEDLIDHITAGLRSSCTYTGAKTIKEFQEKAIVGVQTSHGFSEGRSHEAGW